MRMATHTTHPTLAEDRLAAQSFGLDRMAVNILSIVDRDTPSSTVGYFIEIHGHVDPVHPPVVTARVVRNDGTLGPRIDLATGLGV